MDENLKTDEAGEVSQAVKAKDALRKHQQAQKDAWDAYFYNATSFAELDAITESLAVNDLANTLPILVENSIAQIMSNDEIENKAAAITESVQQIALEFDTRMNQVSSKEKWQPLTNLVKKTFAPLLSKDVPESTSPPDPPVITSPENSFKLSKQADGSFTWLAIYSNKFRDDDLVPEIISEASHQRFDKMLDAGEYPMPELWFYHLEGTTWGKTTFHAYDDNGFCIAGGTIDKDKSQIAQAMIDMAEKEGMIWGVSHGMPIASIKRASDDPTVIIEHQTIEISPLPKEAAANKLTDFLTISEDKTMAVSKNKRDLAEKLGFNIQAIEGSAQAKAAQAHQAGLDFKEAGDAGEVEASAEITVEATIEVTDEAIEEDQPESTEAETFVTRDEVEALIAEIGKQFGGVVSQVKELAEKIDSIQTVDAQAVKEVVNNTPAASLASLFGKSIIGSTEAKVDGRTTLAKDGPDQAAPLPTGNETGIRFIDKLTSVQ